MKKIDGFDSVQPMSDGIDNLPAGGYVCVVKKVTEEPNNPDKGGTHLMIQFDVAEGDYRDFFANDWKSQNREDKWWRGWINQNVPNEKADKYAAQLRYFKKFINDVEESNPNYHWDWNEAGLKGCLIGVIFQDVEKESSRGTRYMTSKAVSVCSVDDIRKGNYKTPDPKMLNAPAYTSAPAAASTSSASDGLPF